MDQHPLPIDLDAEANLSRRGFLRTSLMGMALLGTASLGATLSGCATAPLGTREVDGEQRTYRFLSEDDEVLLYALAPAILAGCLPDDPGSRRQSLAGTIAGVDEAIYRFGPANQAQFRKLFDLLNFGATRALAAGVWSRWENVEPQQAEAFLQRWRNSGIGLFNNGYNALVKVTNVAFYGRPENWHRSNYPGPPDYALAALPQFQKA